MTYPLIPGPEKEKDRKRAHIISPSLKLPFLAFHDVLYDSECLFLSFFILVMPGIYAEIYIHIGS